VSKQETAGYTVGRVADLSGVTIRTLHHYDEIGLLSPSGRSAASYRIYEDRDLERLQQILFYRELGFDLKEKKTGRGSRPRWKRYAIAWPLLSGGGTSQRRSRRT
jgi:hypothetical protein